MNLTKWVVPFLCTAWMTGAIAADEKPAHSAASKVTIYHIEGTRAERVVWLCEELGIPYNLDFKAGDRMGSMQKIRELNPLMPVSPTVKVGDQVMVESGAILELLLAREAKGRLVPAIDSPDFAYHLQWMHFAEGSLAARLFADFRVSRLQGAKETGPRGMDTAGVFRYIDDFLGKHPYFGGKDFTAADIMMLFPIQYAGMLKVVDPKQYANVAAWQRKVEERPAYKRMVQKARPNGWPMG